MEKMGSSFSHKGQIKMINLIVLILILFVLPYLKKQ
jgi:hypothetical protein